MTKLNIGDTVRFLNTTGGGKVKGFQNKQIAIIEDEYGFDVPKNWDKPKLQISRK